MSTDNNTPIVLQPSSIAEKDSKHNRPQKHNIYSQVKHYRYSLISYIVEKYDNSSFKKTTMPFNLNRSISTRVSMIIFLQSKNICAPTITPLPIAPWIRTIKQTAALSSTQENYTSQLVKRIIIRRSQNDVKNKKTFSQQTISTKIKSSTAWIRAHSF